MKVLLEHTRHLGSFVPLVQHKAPSPAARCHITAVSSAAGTARGVPGAHNSPSFAEKQLLLLQPKPRAQLRRQTSHCRQPLPTAGVCQPHNLCGQDRARGSVTGASKASLQKNKPVGHVLSALLMLQALPQLLLVKGQRRERTGCSRRCPAWSLPFFALAGGPRKHEQCLCCTSAAYLRFRLDE